MATRLDTPRDQSTGAGSQEHYIYQALNSRAGQIRLLEILPRASGGLIRCKMVTVVLDKHGSYEALSYTWGKDDATHPIYVDGKLFMVRENLMLAMQNLRGKLTKRRLWIDAICIDQSNTEERSEQVVHMRQIYKQASQVLIWLGPEGSEGDVMRYFGSFGSFYYLAKAEVSLFQVAQFLRRPWFTRVWVVQEVASCPLSILICGKREMKWADFIKGLKIYREIIESQALTMPYFLDKAKSEGNQEAIKALEKVLSVAVELHDNQFRVFNMDLFRNAGDFEPYIHLEDILEYMRGCGATDPRDRVYAALGILSLKTRVISPDYNREIDSVFRETACNIVLDRKNLNLLRYCQPGSDLNLASWMPDWSQRPTASSLAAIGSGFPLLNGKYTPYSASKEPESDFFIEPGSNALLAKGVYLSTIVEIENNPGDREINWRQAAMKCGNGTFVEVLTNRPVAENAVMTPEELEMRSLAYRSGGSVSDAFAFTVTMNRLRVESLPNLPAGKASDPTLMAEAVHEMHRRDVSPVTLTANPFKDHSNPRAMEYVKTLRAMISDTSTYARLFKRQLATSLPGKAFFVTSDKYMGLCTMHAQCADSIVVLKGMEVPLLLRKSDYQDYYTVIGEVYVQGIMEDGEAFQGEDVKIQTFRIH